MQQVASIYGFVNPKVRAETACMGMELQIKGVNFGNINSTTVHLLQKFKVHLFPILNSPLYTTNQRLDLCLETFSSASDILDRGVKSRCGVGYQITREEKPNTPSHTTNQDSCH
ncbi:hypothetical protein HZ326_24880 [Fusarium oxysporum f. sp. albedinis]|nr:hypothetical protein HZ326_24880 [Fusarium oxysporum f. sp. albedinis]